MVLQIIDFSWISLGHVQTTDKSLFALLLLLNYRNIVKRYLQLLIQNIYKTTPHLVTCELIYLTNGDEMMMQIMCVYLFFLYKFGAFVILYF